jgi:hypothetical protein
MSSTALDNNAVHLIRHNVSLVKKVYPTINRLLIQALKELTIQFVFSFASGDLILLETGWFVTHAGLLRLAQRQQCLGIDCALEEKFCDPSAGRWVFKATLFKNETQSFVGYGDADPSNVSALVRGALVRGAEMRIAETRAVNRALRKAYGIGICSVEELGSKSGPVGPTPDQPKFPPSGTNGKHNGNGASCKVRDRLCQIIRQHKLDPVLVKTYAVDFCGSKTLKEAAREKVEEFVQQLVERAEKDRDGLLCQLNSYVRPSEEVVA